MRRYYFLDRLTRRVGQLQERAEYLEDFAVLVNRERDLSYQSDLARDYEQLYNDVNFLDIELLTARLPHRNQAMMLISAMGASAQCAGETRPRNGRAACRRCTCGGRSVKAMTAKCTCSRPILMRRAASRLCT